MIYLCVDCGKTKIHGGLFDDNILLKEMEHPNIILYNDIINVIDQLITPNVQMIIVGIYAIYSFKQMIKKLKKKYLNIIFISDCLLAFYSNEYDKNKLMVLGGTSSIIMGKIDGKMISCLGYGHHLFEVGSAYSLIKAKIIEIIKRMEKGKLHKLDYELLDYFNIKNVTDFKKLFIENNVSYIASFARYIKYDNELLDIIKKEARIVAKNILDKLEENKTIYLFFRGSYAINNMYYQRIIINNLSKKLKVIEVEDKVKSPISGGYNYLREVIWKII